METPAQQDRSIQLHDYMADACAAEIDALQAARQVHRETLDGNDTGLSEDEAQARLDAAQKNYDEAYRRAYDAMPTIA